VKELSGKITQKIPINDVDASLKSLEEQSNRWKEHFQAILNCPEPDYTHDFGDLQGDELNIEGEIAPEEVYRVIKKMKNGKAPGIDGIQAELLKSGGKEMIKRLTKLCNQVWEMREVPGDWKDGIIVTIPKKVI